MKKLLICLVLFTALVGSVFAAESNISTTQEKDESKWSSLSYVTVPILKVLDSREAFVVIYQKDKLGTGSVVIPKAWAKGSPESPRKLKVRTVKYVKDSYMTVVKNDGEFSRVILSLTKSRNNSLWGVVDYRKAVEGIDKTTLEELDI